MADGSEMAAHSSAEELNFHKLFPSIAATEKLVEHFQCGLSRKKIVRMGRLYLSALRLCFFSSFPKEMINVEWDDVTSISKKSSFLFEAVSVQSSKGELMFQAFMSGATDPAFKLMHTLWTVRTKYGGKDAPVGLPGTPGSVTPTADELLPTQSKSAPELHLENNSFAKEKSDSGKQSQARTPEISVITPPESLQEPAQEPEHLKGTPRPSQLQEERRPSAEEAIKTPTTNTVPPKSPHQSPSKELTNDIPESAHVEDSEHHAEVVETSKENVEKDNHNDMEKEKDDEVAATTLPPQKHGKSRTHSPPRRTELQKHFPQLAQTEKALDVFQCSYVCGVHRIGKMHITANYILFISVMLQEGVCIHFSEVLHLEKLQTLLVFDGISVVTKAKTYEFTSFVSRENAFRILQQLHTAHACKAQFLQEQQQLEKTELSQEVTDRHNGNGDEGQTGVTNGAVSASLATIVQTKGPNVVASTATTGSPPPQLSSLTSLSQSREFSFVTSTAVPFYDCFAIGETLDAIDNYPTDFGTAFSSYELCSKRSPVPAVTYPPGYTIFDIFSTMFDDGNKFAHEYHSARKGSNIEFDQWRACPGAPPCCGQRTLSSDIMVRAIFEVKCKYTEYERFIFIVVNGAPHLILHFSGQAIGVKFSDAFRVESLLVYSQQGTGADAVVTCNTYAYIQFVKSCWIRGKVESTAFDELKVYKFFHEIGIKRVSEKPPCGFLGVSQSSEPKQRAPSIPVISSQLARSSHSATPSGHIPVALRVSPAKGETQSPARLPAIVLIWCGIISSFYAMYCCWFATSNSLLGSRAEDRGEFDAIDALIAFFRPVVVAFLWGLTALLTFLLSRI